MYGGGGGKCLGCCCAALNAIVLAYDGGSLVGIIRSAGNGMVGLTPGVVGGVLPCAFGFVDGIPAMCGDVVC